MATKYILAGGLDLKNLNYWDNLGKEVTVGKPIKVLSCFFSQPKEKKWELGLTKFKPFFARAFGNDVIVNLASVEDFLKQIDDCDVLYLHGGSSHRLKSVLSRFENLEKHFKDKIVIGSSAGANYLAEAGWLPGLREAIKGSGIVPLNVLVHFGSTFEDDGALGPIDWAEAQNQLQEFIGQEQKITKLPEGEFVVFEK